MKKSIAALLLALAPVATFAQGKVYLGGGLSMNQAPSAFEKNYKKGVNFEAGYGYALTPNVEVIAKGEIHNFSPNPDAFGTSALAATLNGGTFSDAAVNAGVKLNFGAGKIKPYVVATGGFQSLQTKALSITVGSNTINYDEADESAFGVNVGVGVEVGFGGAASLFVEPSYTMLFNDAKTKFIPVKVGLAYSLLGKK